MSGRWMIYGANGYTGRLIVEEARRRGLAPIAAGRNRSAVEALGLESRVFDLDAIDLAGVSTVLHCAGPFSRTSRAMVDACIAAGVHYLDITGEIRVFEDVLARDDEAKARGSVLLPGAGFDVVPSDCLAARLAAELPGATSLELAFSSGGGPSTGTAKTMVEALPAGGLIRENGALKKVPTAWKTADIPFSDKVRHAMSIPWGDVATAYRSTKIPNIVVYMAVAEPAARVLKVAEPLLGLFAFAPVRRVAEALLERAQLGPKEDQRKRTRTHLWGRVRDDAGKEVSATLDTIEGYTLTAQTAVEIAERVTAGAVAPGAYTPSQAFGAGFIETFAGTELRVSPR